MLPTERIELGDGDYALVYKDLLRKTSRLVQQFFRGHMKRESNLVPLSELGKTPIFSDYKIDLSTIDEDEVAEIFILNQVSEWSYGPIKHESIENMPDVKYQLLKKELNRLYTPSPLVEKPASS